MFKLQIIKFLKYFYLYFILNVILMSQMFYCSDAHHFEDPRPHKNVFFI